MKRNYALVILMICVGCNSVFAYDLQYRPSLSTSVTWDDNIEDEPIDEKEDVFLAVSPRLIVDGRGERSRFIFDGRVSGEVYNKFEEFNDINTYRLSGNLYYDPSQLMNIRLNSSFIFTPSAETERQDVVVEDGGVPITNEITRRADRYRINIDPSIRYSFNERLSSRLSGSFRTTQYTEDVGGVTDSITYGVGGGMGYALTRKTTGGINVSFEDVDFENEENNDAKIYSSFLSFDHTYSRNTTLTASGGVSYLSIEGEDNEIAFVGSAGARLRFKRASYLVEFSRSITESSFGNTNTRDRGRARLEVPLSRRMNLRLNGGVSRNRSSNGDEDLLIKRVDLRIEFKPLMHLSLFLRGSSEDQEERAVAGEDLRINRVTAGFVLSANIEGN